MALQVAPGERGEHQPLLGGEFVDRLGIHGLRTARGSGVPVVLVHDADLHQVGAPLRRVDHQRGVPRLDDPLVAGEHQRAIGQFDRQIAGVDQPPVAVCGSAGEHAVATADGRVVDTDRHVHLLAVASEQQCVPARRHGVAALRTQYEDGPRRRRRHSVGGAARRQQLGWEVSVRHIAYLRLGSRQCRSGPARTGPPAVCAPASCVHRQHPLRGQELLDSLPSVRVSSWGTVDDG